jgi:hypothetical protein
MLGAASRLSPPSAQRKVFCAIGKCFLGEFIMSDRDSWKMLHILYTLRPGIPGLNADQLAKAGIYCGPDTIQPLVDGEAVLIDSNGRYELSKSARTILRCCILTNRRWPGKDMLVDYPDVFVAMPFRESWSADVYEQMIKPAVEGAGLNCTRGDELPRVGDLTQTIWSALMQSGLVIADVSAPNPNVFYEIGLIHALGKDTFILKQKDAKVPADFGGSHYYEYDINKLSAGKILLKQEIESWAAQNGVEGVRNIYEVK